jgi:Domain of unknown function (DUF1707)
MTPVLARHRLEGGQLSTQQAQATSIRPIADVPQTRASDADRDRTVGLLNAAFAEGRLTADEHDQRLSTAYAARTWHQLRELTVDLPTLAGTVAERRSAPPMLGGADRCLLCALLIMCPPAGIAWWLLSRRRPAADPRRALRREGEHAQDR